jgi:3-hydroxyacyl-CoA dehydrogenase/enoyl-CoA hydratase/3-hydroxybutyryl-CoA epimerase
MSDSNSGKVRIERLESGVCILRLGDSSERVVTITEQRMASLREALKELRAQRPCGVIVAGPHADMFTAGADISLIQKVTDPAFGAQLAKEGQLAFAELEALPFPTVAAISGPCVGGGCELALACKYRVIADRPSSIIGLPEIKLGILPGFGGTQRLPKVVGLPKALDIILAGKTLKAAQALKAGLVDGMFSFEQLISAAERLIIGSEQPKRRTLTLTDRFLTHTALGRSILKKKATQSVQKETKGFYPAPLAALNCCISGFELPPAKAYELEANELGRLIVTPESKSLVQLFFLTEASKALGKSGRKAVEHVHALVIGAGVMGAGIAGTLARNDAAVILKDSSEQSLQRGMNHIKAQLEKSRSLKEQDRSFILNRIEPTTKESANMGNVTIAIEAIVENMDAKKSVLKEASKLMGAESIVATNTSSLSVSEIAKAIENPSRVVGMHFFNPVEKMPLVEIVRGKQTSDKTVVLVAALTSKIGKFPIVVSDVPGFLVNRILTPYLIEASQLLLEGYAIADIDKAALKFGMPMGPIRLLDEVGLDVAVHVLETMRQGYGDRMFSPNILSKMLEAKRLGKKNNAGFYDYNGDDITPHSGVRNILGITESKREAQLEAIQERLMLRLVNEAVRCLDEGVAGTPGKEAAEQIDLGTVMGMGFPPFRGGLIRYAESLGAKAIHEALKKLESKEGKRFEAWSGIYKRAQNGASFYAAIKS